MNAGTCTLNTVGAFAASSRRMSTAAYRLASTRSGACNHPSDRRTSDSTTSAVSAPPTCTRCPSARLAASASSGSHVGVKTSRRYVAKRFILPTFSPILTSVSWSMAYTPPSRRRTSGEFTRRRMRPYKSRMYLAKDSWGLSRSSASTCSRREIPTTPPARRVDDACADPGGPRDDPRFFRSARDDDPAAELASRAASSPVRIRPWAPRASANPPTPAPLLR